MRNEIRSALLMALLTLSSGTGCASSSPEVQAPLSSEAQVRAWLDEGKRLAKMGQSLKAEEYLIAAWDAGTTAQAVAPTLIETCVQAGRYRSALLHVQRARREEPDEPRLMQLAATLYLALGQGGRAHREVIELEAHDPDYPEGVYFLGDYLQSRGRHERARIYFERFLERWPDAENAAWVRHRLRTERKEPAVAQLPRSDEASPRSLEPRLR